MKRTKLEHNVKTKSTTVTEVEVTLEEEVEEAKQQRVMEIQERMREIEVELRESDWRTVKFIEGALPEADFNPHKIHRVDLRSEYNAIETELKNLLV